MINEMEKEKEREEKKKGVALSFAVLRCTSFDNKVNFQLLLTVNA